MGLSEAYSSRILLALRISLQRSGSGPKVRDFHHRKRRTYRVLMRRAAARV
jgi:hypothetical protein